MQMATFTKISHLPSDTTLAHWSTAWLSNFDIFAFVGPDPGRVTIIIQCYTVLHSITQYYTVLYSISGRRAEQGLQKEVFQSIKAFKAQGNLTLILYLIQPISTFQWAFWTSQNLKSEEIYKNSPQQNRDCWGDILPLFEILMAIW